jgi:hypothetical protein
MIALAAAYLVALQALLLPLSVAAGNPFMGSPCVSSASQPVGHDAGCPCAAGCGMQCCVQALAAPVPVLAERIPVTAFVTVPPLAPVVLARSQIRSSALPRAPPVV